MTDSEILARAKSDWQDSTTHWGKWRKEAKEDYAFVAGDQWSEEQKQQLRDQIRPAVTFNRIDAMVSAVSGSEVANRQEVRYYPREPGDSGVNELFTSAAQYVRDECDAEDEESDSFLDTLICGLGVTETALSYEESLDGEILIERVDPLDVWADPGARKRNLVDSRFVFRHRDYTKEAFLDEFPDADIPGYGEMNWGLSTDPVKVDGTDEWKYESDDSRVDTRKTIRVVEYQWKEKEDVYRVLDPRSGKAVELDEKRFRFYKKQQDELLASRDQYGMDMDYSMQPLEEGVNYAKQRRTVVKQAFIAGNQILKSGYSPIRTELTYKFITGKRDRNNGTWYGLVRTMKDPQRWANKFFTSMIDIINKNSKGGIIAQSTAVADKRKFIKDWSNPAAVHFIDGDPNTAIKEKTPGVYPAGLANLMQFAIQSIRDSSGINMEMLGLADRDQPGILEEQRKRAGMTILATMFDSLRRYRKVQGRLLLKFIQEYISDGRLIRLSDEFGKQYVPLVRRPDVVEFDVIVDEAPASTNNKERVWSMVSGFLPQLVEMPAGDQLLLEVLRYSPLPESLVSKFEEVLSQQGQDPMQDQMAQLEVGQRQADIEKTKSETAENYADAQAKGAKVQLEAVKTRQDMARDMMQAMRPVVPRQ